MRYNSDIILSKIYYVMLHETQIFLSQKWRKKETKNNGKMCLNHCYSGQQIAEKHVMWSWKFCCRWINHAWVWRCITEDLISNTHIASLLPHSIDLFDVYSNETSDAVPFPSCYWPSDLNGMGNLNQKFTQINKT